MRTLFGALFCAVFLCTGSLRAADQPKLSEAGRAALFSLGETDTFSDAAVGSGGRLSKQAAAFRVLMNESAADAAFKWLLDHAALPGQLYGLCGVYFTDHAFFLVAVERFRNYPGEVRTERGCMTEPSPVAPLVASEHPRAVRLSGPSETIESWRQRNPGEGGRMDILGGAYPVRLLRYPKP